MYYYIIFGLYIESDLCLDGLEEKKTGNKPDVIISQGKIDQELIYVPEDEKNSDAGYWYLEKDKRICVREANTGAFLIENGNTIHYVLFDGYDQQYVNQLVICVSLAILRVQRGLISIHGSGVRINENTYIISGDSGAGKSTFTTELLKHGAGFLSDDICAITFSDGIPYVQSSFPQRKLCKDAVDRFGYDINTLIKLPEIEKGKYIVNQKDCFIERPSKLSGMVVIKIGNYEKVNIKKIEGAKSLKYVIDNLIKLDVYQFLGNSMDMYRASASIAKNIPIYLIERPENQETLDEMMEQFQLYVTNETILK